MKQLHESNPMFQGLVGKTVSAVEYIDDYNGGINLRFTDGSFLAVFERTQAGELEVCASIYEKEL